MDTTLTALPQLSSHGKCNRVAQIYYLSIVQAGLCFATS